MKIKSLAAFFLLFLSLSQCAFGQVTEATERGTASGSSKRQAIESAVVQAAGQAFGMTINAVTTTSDSTTITGGESSSSSKFLTTVNDQIQQKIKSPTNNPILGYSVDSLKQLPNSYWEATITLKYAKYNAIGQQSSRRSMVVITNEKAYKEILLSDFSKALVGIRRFDVLNRNNQNLFDKERAFITSGDAGRAEVSRLGQATGADYLAIIELKGLNISNNKRENIQMTGETIVSSSASGMVSVEVIEFSSRKLKWSGSEKFGSNYDGATAVSNSNLSTLISNASDKLVNNLVASIYPIEVVKVLGKKMAVINRGSNSIKMGQKLTFYLKGDELTDKQSGENLGALEIKIGSGRIVDANPKYSTVKLDDGDFDTNSNYIAR
jgi:hypothetical protein